jgi:hypothetical protein
MLSSIRNYGKYFPQNKLHLKKRYSQQHSYFTKNHQNTKHSYCTIFVFSNVCVWFQKIHHIYVNVRINSNLYEFHEKGKTHCNLYCHIHVGGEEKIVR